MTGVSLIAFVLAVYLPQAFFKLWAERYVDLGRRKNASQFEEITAPILPSLFLHLQSWLVIKAVCLLENLMPFLPWHFPSPDWQLILTLSDTSSVSRIAKDANDWLYVMWPLSYIVVVACVTFINGVAFGRGALNGIFAKADERVSPGSHLKVKPHGWYAAFKTYVAAIVFWFWKLFYYENFVTTFPWATLKPFVFVKTKDGSLFHGRFDSYETTREGDINLIVLHQATRFTRRPINEALADGEHPLHPLKGVLVLKWPEVVDINITLPGEIQALYRKYESLRTKAAPANP